MNYKAVSLRLKKKKMFIPPLNRAKQFVFNVLNNGLTALRPFFCMGNHLLYPLDMRIFCRVQTLQNVDPIILYSIPNLMKKNLENNF